MDATIAVCACAFSRCAVDDSPSRAYATAAATATRPAFCLNVPAGDELLTYAGLMTCFATLAKMSQVVVEAVVTGGLNFFGPYLRFASANAEAKLELGLDMLVLA